MKYGIIWVVLLSNMIFAAEPSGAVWTLPQSVPSMSKNVVFPTYDPRISQVVATWIDDVNFPASNAAGFSSNFNGASWSPIQQVPVDGVFVNVLLSAYGPAQNTLVGTWTDLTGSPNSSFYDGVWSGVVPIPDGGAGAFLAFPSFDPLSGNLVAVWADMTGNGEFSIFNGTSWSPTPMPHPATNSFVVFPSSALDNLVTTWVDTATNIGYSSTYNGTTWSTPQVIASNIEAPNLIPLLTTPWGSEPTELVVTWADAVTHQVFSAVFNGSSWSSPLLIPGSLAEMNTGVFSAYDPVIGRIVAIWADQGLMQGAFSEYDGTGWTTAQAIPGSTLGRYTGVFDPAIGKLIAIWSDQVTNLGYYSLFHIPSIPFAVRGNLAHVANYINFIGQSAAMQPILAKLILLSPEEQEKALRSISNARNAFLPWTAGLTALSFDQTMSNRAAELRWYKTRDRSYTPDFLSLVASAANSYCQPECCFDNFYSLWAEGFGTFAHQKEQDQNPSFDADTGGVLAGFDATTERFSLLTSFNYAHTHIDQDDDLGEGTINSYAGTIFGVGYYCDGFLEVGFTGVYNTYDSNRHIFFPGFDARARASFNGWQAVPHVALGYDFYHCDFIFEPFASADIAVIHQDSFSETGADPLSVHQNSNTSELLQARAGFRTYYTQSPCWGHWFIRVLLAYQYQKGWDVGRISNAFFVGSPAGFTVTSLNNAQNSFVPGLEFFVQGNNGLFSSVAYSGTFARQYMDNSVYLKVGYTW